MRKLLLVVKGFFTTNISLKLISILLACTLWVYITIMKTTISYFPGSLPVEVRNVPTGLAAIYDPQKIKVKMQASPDTLMKLGIDNFNVYADLGGLMEGTYVVNINAIVNLPNVIVVEKSPNTMLVRLEPVVRKLVPIRVRISGQAKSGFVPGDPIVSPSQVEIKGPISLIDEISELETTIKLDGEGRDFQKRTKLSLESGNQRSSLIELSHKSVNVLMPIVPSSGTKTVGVRVKIKGEPATNYYVSRIDCRPAVVEISSSIGSLQSYQFLETQEIDITSLESNLEKEVEITVPADLKVKISRVWVKITLSLNTLSRPIWATFNFKMNPDLKVTSIDPVKVVVLGPADIIAKLTPDKVIITLDLQKRKAGTLAGFNIEGKMISLPQGCTAISWSPPAVNITIEGNFNIPSTPR